MHDSLDSFVLIILSACNTYWVTD